MSEAAVGSVGSVNCDKVNGCDWVNSNKVIAYASLGMAALTTLTAINMQKKELDIANQYYAMSRELHDYFFITYLPREKEMIDEAFAEPQYVAKYDMEGGRAVAVVNRQYKTVYDDLNRCATRYCTGIKRAMIADMVLQQSMARADAQNYAFRSEESRKDAKDDHRFARRKEMVALGRNMLQTSSSYAQIASTAYGTMAGQAGEAAKATVGEAMRRLAPEQTYNEKSLGGSKRSANQETGADKKTSDSAGVVGRVARDSQDVTGAGKYHPSNYAPGGSTSAILASLKNDPINPSPTMPQRPTGTSDDKTHIADGTTSKMVGSAAGEPVYVFVT